MLSNVSSCYAVNIWQHRLCGGKRILLQLPCATNVLRSTISRQLPLSIRTHLTIAEIIMHPMNLPKNWHCPLQFLINALEECQSPINQTNKTGLSAITCLNSCSHIAHVCRVKQLDMIVSDLQTFPAHVRRALPALLSELITDLKFPRFHLVHSHSFVIFHIGTKRRFTALT